ncbi:hypothetical protein BgiBS90_015126, partial [Biomphalaria glabrata]
SSLNVCLFIVMTSSLCELCSSADKGTKSPVTPKLFKLMGSLHAQASAVSRSRRSYLDNKIDTFPQHPDYHAYHSDDYYRTHLRPDELDSERDYESAMAGRSYPRMVPKDERFAPIQMKAFQGLDLDDAPELDDVDLENIDDIFGAALPKKFNIHAPVRPEAKAKADNILQEFMEYMNLKESGALDLCLSPARRK